MPTVEHHLLDGLFRQQSARLVAGLARALGPARLDLAEDAVHDALVDALRRWPFTGVPRDPAAWLAAAARRRAVDRLRREQVRERHLAGVAAAAPGEPAEPPLPDEASAIDDQLRMLLACAAVPELPLAARVTLALKTLCGFSTREIGRAFRIGEAAVEQRLVRARRALAEGGPPTLALPEPARVPDAARAAGEVLYALFTEGHAAHAGRELVRAELADEAIRLGELLLHLPAARLPELHALLALMHLAAARLPARVDGAGELQTLARQDRARWDRNHLARGFAHLERAAAGERLHRWHLEALIQSCHARAASFADTDWPTILSAYDRLLQRAPSPVVALHRAIALAHVDGPAAGLRALAALHREGRLATDHLLPAARGEMLRRLGDLPSAAAAWREALALAPTEPERRHLRALLTDHGFEP